MKNCSLSNSSEDVKIINGNHSSEHSSDYYSDKKVNHKLSLPPSDGFIILITFIPYVLFP